MCCTVRAMIYRIFKGRNPNGLRMAETKAVARVLKPNPWERGHTPYRSCFCLDLLE